MSKVGLIIDNKKPIKKISGPVKSSILIPKKQLLKDEEGLGCSIFNLPVFLNFGDIHYSKDLDCSVVMGECKRPDCYKISDSKFLKRIDRLGEKYNIDLYLESFEPIGDFEYNFPKKDYISELTYNNIDCVYKRKGQDEIKYGKNLSKTYKLRCPTENIKWHFADVRNIVYHKTDRIIAKYINKPYFLTSFLMNLFRISHDPISIHNYFESVYNILMEFSQNNITKYYNVVLPNFKKILEIIFIEQDRNITHYINEVILGQRFREYSIIYKQLMKQNRKNYNLWISWIKDFVKYNFKNMKSYRDRDEGRLFVELFIQGLLPTPKDNNFYIYFINSLMKMTGYIVSSQAILLDIYFLLRVFKILPSRDNPELVISYFGYSHTNNIEYFLTHIMEYYDKFTIQEVQSPVATRCISINTTWDLEKILGENKKFNQKLECMDF